MGVRHGRQFAHWLALNGLVRGIATIGLRFDERWSRFVADPEVLANPVPFYEELRSAGPLVRTPFSFFAVDYAVNQQILRSDAFHVMVLGRNLPKPIRWLEGRLRDNLYQQLRPPSVVVVEPPAHTRYRKVMSPAFAPKAVAALRGQIEGAASRLLDSLAEQGPVVDVTEEYCAPLAAAVMGDFLGIPCNDDRSHITKLARMSTPSADFASTWPEYRQAQRGIEGLNLFLDRHIQHLQRAPGSDFLSALIRGSTDGPPELSLNAAELGTIPMVLIDPGLIAIVDSLCNGIEMLLGAPDQVDLLNEKPQLWPNAVAELLRLEPPGPITVRVARKDLEIAGTEMKKGDQVILLLGAANRDPSVFANPHALQVERINASKHLSFSAGRHVCLGMALGRLSLEVGLGMFFDRYPKARAIAGESRRETRTRRGWSSFPVELVSSESTAEFV